MNGPMVFLRAVMRVVFDRPDSGPFALVVVVLTLGHEPRDVSSTFDAAWTSGCMHGAKGLSH